MAYVITEACIDVLDAGCTGVCPVDCIYLGLRSRYIHPDECIDCGACVDACPVEAIFFAADVPDALGAFVTGNSEFFSAVLPGASEPLGSPGGADRCPEVGRDTPLVAGHE